MVVSTMPKALLRRWTKLANEKQRKPIKRSMKRDAGDARLAQPGCNICGKSAAPVRVLGMKTPRIFLLLIVVAIAAALTPAVKSQKATPAPKAGAAPQLVIIDTDIGDDIDDAFALALALRSP